MKKSRRFNPVALGLFDVSGAEPTLTHLFIGQNMAVDGVVIYVRK